MVQILFYSKAWISYQEVFLNRSSSSKYTRLYQGMFYSSIMRRLYVLGYFETT
jgi:hypothetical protein